MTQFSMLPWTTGAAGDGATPYTQEQSNNFFRFFDVRNPASEGVALGVLNELAVSGSASPLSVATGAAVCYGRYWNDSVVSLAVSTPGVGTTGGRVVLRCTWATRQVRLAVKMSANGIATPPTLTQTFGTTWEISLATFTITTGGAITLTDDRSFRKATFLVDTAAIENLAVTTAKLANLNVTTEKIAEDAVDYTKAGNGIIQLVSRQGGNAVNWGTAGLSNYLIGASIMQTGVAWMKDTAIAVGATATRSIVYEFPFGGVPILTFTFNPGYGESWAIPYRIVSSSEAGFSVEVKNNHPTLTVFISISWQAVGPE
ncbi:MAG: hypothetical protein IT327_02605 [Anaerolineae bacterium]|nr:hypothetical protein [Anaerolineae bacterium]